MVEVHKQRPEYQCDQCGQEFLSQYKLKFHVYSHHSDKKHHKCHHCDKSFKQNSELKRHLFVHEKDDPNIVKFQCEECGKKCRDKATLGYHINTHTGEKPYKCQYCSYSAAALPSLHCHRRDNRCKQNKQLKII